MAFRDIELSGKARQDGGSGVEDITVYLLHTADDLDGTQEATDTTDGDGTWNFTETSRDFNYDIKIVSSSGAQQRYIPWSDEIALKTVDTSVMKVRGATNAAAAPIYLLADLATDAGDAWRIQATDSNTLAIGNDKASAGTIIDYITIANGATAAASITTILGQLTIGVNDTGADVKFFGATAGKYWLWDESADGVVQIGTLTVGVDNTGHDVKFFGATSGAYMLWDESADDLVLAGAAGIDLAGDIDVDGTANLDVVDIDGNVQIDGTVTVGVNDTGKDVKFFGATSGAYLLWDESADKLLTAGNTFIDIVKDKLMIGSTAVTTTAAELNVLDAVTAGTVAASLGVVVDSNKDIGSFRNITLAGELDAGSLDVSGDANIAGEVQTAGIGYTDGDNAMTIADGGAVTFPAIPVFSGGIVASQATGDIVYASSSSALARLGIGATDRVLSVSSGLPVWRAEEKVVQMRVFDVAIDTATGDRKATFVVPSTLNLMNLISVHAEVDTAGTTNTLDIQLRNVTQTADMLSTKLTIDTGETGSDTAATVAVINTSEDDLATYDVIAIDVDAIHSTAAKGLVITMIFRLA